MIEFKNGREVARQSAREGMAGSVKGEANVAQGSLHVCRDSRRDFVRYRPDATADQRSAVSGDHGVFMTAAGALKPGHHRRRFPTIWSILSRDLLSRISCFGGGGTCLEQSLLTFGHAQNDQRPMRTGAIRGEWLPGALSQTKISAVSSVAPAAVRRGRLTYRMGVELEHSARGEPPQQVRAAMGKICRSTMPKRAATH